MYKIGFIDLMIMGCSSRVTEGKANGPSTEAGEVAG